MKIEVILSEEVFRRFTMFDILKRRRMWRSPAIWAAILCSSAVICFAMNHVRGAVLLGGVLLLVGLGMPFSYFANFASSLKKQILTLGLSRPLHVYTLVLTEKARGIRVTNGKEQADYEWRIVHHAYRDKLATYLFITKERGFILPHDCVEEGDDALWELLRKKIPAERRTDLRK